MKTNEMTPDQIRVRCAELEGWHSFESSPLFKRTLGTSPAGRHGADLPDYCNSIDAINAVVLRLSPKKHREWIDAISEIVNIPEGLKSGHFDYADALAIATASALDRARAFVAIHES